MHITRTQAAVAHIVPMVHVLDLIENKAIGSKREAAAARTFAVQRLLQNGLKHGICEECMKANAEWYSKSFDACVEAHHRDGGFSRSTYPEFESPCWPTTPPSIILPPTFGLPK